MQDINLRLLKVFLAVAEAGGFSRAAASLSVTQPILSRQIKALERELGAELFYRNGRGTVLTQAGEIFSIHARSVVCSMDHAARDLQALSIDPVGEVVLGLPPTVGDVLSTSLVTNFRQKYPRVALGVVAGFSGHVLEWLAGGRIDVAVLYSNSQTAMLEADEILEEALVLVGPASDPAGVGPTRNVEGSTVAGLSLILPSRLHGLRILVSGGFNQLNLPLRVDIEMDSLNSILDLVQTGIGYTVLPYVAIHKLVIQDKLRYWPMTAPRLTRHLVLATSTTRPMTSVTRNLATMVKESVRSLVADGVWRPLGADGD